MPKASVNEDNQALPPKDKIRVAGHRPMTTPARNAVGAENAHQLQFRPLVPLGTDGCHHLGPLFLCEDVGHPGTNREPHPVRWPILSQTGEVDTLISGMFKQVSIISIKNIQIDNFKLQIEENWHSRWER